MFVLWSFVVEKVRGRGATAQDALSNTRPRVTRGKRSWPAPLAVALLNVAVPLSVPDRTLPLTTACTSRASLRPAVARHSAALHCWSHRHEEHRAQVTARS